MDLKKRGMFFTLDAMLASSIIITAIIISSHYYVGQSDYDAIDFLSQDIVRVFTELRVSELDNDFVEGLIINGNISRSNNTIIEQIGQFWSEDDLDMASAFARNVTESLIPHKFGVGIWVDDDLIYTRSKTIENSLISSRKLISGITKEKPTYGVSSRAFLRSITKKSMYAYAYYGGFVGQGNLTRYLEYIPQGSTILSSTIEFDAGSDFSLYINDVLCNNFVVVRKNMTARRWDISTCNGLFSNGIQNKIYISFDGLLNESFIAGGYVKVEYETDEFSSNSTAGIDNYYLPGIDGLINLYSSFDVPGNLLTIDMFIHFYNNRTTYLNIGDQTLFTTTGSSTDQYINLTNIPFVSSPQTIPIRMGVGNLSEAVNITSGEPSDSVLVTDVSGSMNDCGLTGDTEL